MKLRRAVAALLMVVVGVAGAASVETAVPAAPAASAASASDADCPEQPADPTPEEAAQGRRDAADNGLLWKATRNGRVVYLYGTIHIAQQSWTYPGPKTLAAMRASDVVALELDLADPAVLARLARAIVRQPGSPVLPPALQARLEAQMASSCIAPFTLALLRPEMQAVTIEVMQGRRFGLYPAYAIDEAITKLAGELGKPLRALETPEMQAGLLVSDDPHETAETVSAVLDELESGKGPQMLQRLANDWQRGDLADLDAYRSWCECLDTPQQRADFRKLIDERNPLMADKIVQWHAQGKSLFVAIGSLHMVGKIGLPALLKARGFRVERVTFGPAGR